MGQRPRASGSISNGLGSVDAEVQLPTGGRATQRDSVPGQQGNDAKRDGQGMTAGLLELQDADSELDRLRSERAHLAERATAAELRAQLGAVGAEVAATEENLSVARARHRDLEGEVARLSARVASLRAALKQGSASSRDLGAMDHELVGAQQRLDQSEDATLEVLEEIDRLERLLAERAATSERLSQQLVAADAALASAEADVASRAARVVHRRVEAAHLVPSDLMRRYEAMRAKLDGVAVARLVDRSCGGCHLELSPTELARLRSAPPGSLLTCESCGRILVP